jgi:hypothetical protein
VAPFGRHHRRRYSWAHVARSISVYRPAHVEIITWSCNKACNYCAYHLTLLHSILPFEYTQRHPICVYCIYSWRGHSWWIYKLGIILECAGTFCRNVCHVSLPVYFISCVKSWPPHAFTSSEFDESLTYRNVNQFRQNKGPSSVKLLNKWIRYYTLACQILASQE